MEAVLLLRGIQFLSEAMDGGHAQVRLRTDKVQNLVWSGESRPQRCRNRTTSTSDIKDTLRGYNLNELPAFR